MGEVNYNKTVFYLSDNVMFRQCHISIFYVFLLQNIS